MVVNQIAMKSYERSLINPIKTEVIEKSDDLINEIFKDTFCIPCNNYACVPVRFL